MKSKNAFAHTGTGEDSKITHLLVTFLRRSPGAESKNGKVRFDTDAKSSRLLR